MTRQRILIVDDEPDIRELLEITLLRMGLETRSVEDSQRVCCMTRPLISA
jgi:two-component system response regulator PilR (NtrC family)